MVCSLRAWYRLNCSGANGYAAVHAVAGKNDE